MKDANLMYTNVSRYQAVIKCPACWVVAMCRQYPYRGFYSMSTHRSVVEKGFNCCRPEVDSRTKSTYESIKIVWTYSIGRSAMSSAIGLDCVGQTVACIHSI